MGTMTNQPAQVFRPPESVALASSVSAAVWYPLHEGTGTTVADKLGSGPDLTLGGTAGGWGTWGAFTPNGSDMRFSSGALNAHLNSIFGWRDLTGQMILIGYDFQSDGAGGTESLFWWGRNTSSGEGAYGMEFSSTMQHTLQVRGSTGATAVAAALASTAMAHSDRVAGVIEIHGVSAGEVQCYVRQWRYGTGLQPGGVATGINPLGTGVAAPGNDTVHGLTLFARPGNTSTTFDRYMGATAGSNAKLNNFWAARLTSIDTSAGQAALLAMVDSPREFPISLRGAA